MFMFINFFFVGSVLRRWLGNCVLFYSAVGNSYIIFVGSGDFCGSPIHLMDVLVRRSVYWKFSFLDSVRIHDEVCGSWILWLLVSRFCYGVV